MKKIIENLYVGDWDDAVKSSKDNSVDAIVYVGQELPKELSHETKIPVIHIPLKDGKNCDLRIHLILGTLGYLTLEDKTLLACRAGISRSPTLAVAYLAVYHGYRFAVEDEKSYTFAEAFDFMHKITTNYQPQSDLLCTVKNVVKSYWRNTDVVFKSES